MADSFGLLDYGDVVLGVKAIESGFAVGPAVAEPAPLVEQELGRVQVFDVAGGAVELAQTDLDLLMPRRVGASARAEHVADVVGASGRDVEEGLVPGHLVVG